jgi:tRNA pseudouridine38-40 synthase
VVEEKLSIVLNKPTRVNAAGRTDAYVHANNQVCNFETTQKLITGKIKSSLNKILPEDIYIKSIKEVNSKFHARFSCIKKEYVYLIYTGEKNVFFNNHYLHYKKKINLPLIRKAAKLLVGKHDFKSFSISDKEETVRTIKSIIISKDENIIKIKVVGDGFLRGMVRMIVGTLLDINEEKKELADIEKLLNNPFKGSAITKVKGCGLYLNKV